MFDAIQLEHVWETELDAFTIPAKGRLLVLDGDGLHEIRWLPKVTVITMEAYNSTEEMCDGDWPILTPEIYDSERDTLTYHGTTWDALGLGGGSPILTDQRGNELRLDVAGENLAVVDRYGDIAQKISYGAVPILPDNWPYESGVTAMEGWRVTVGTSQSQFSDIWAFATFSVEGDIIALGTSNNLYLFRWTED